MLASKHEQYINTIAVMETVAVVKHSQRVGAGESPTVSSRSEYHSGAARVKGVFFAE